MTKNAEHYTLMYVPFMHVCVRLWEHLYLFMCMHAH
jgi:hypothetical protein